MIHIVFSHHVTNYHLTFYSSKQFREVVDNTPKMTIAKRVTLHRCNMGRKLLRIVLD